MASLHRKKMQDIDDAEAGVPALMVKAKELESILETTKVNDPIKYKELLIEIQELQAEIEKIKVEKINYLLKNGELLYRFTECDKKRKNRIHSMKILKNAHHPSISDESKNKHKYYWRYRSNIDPDYVYAPEQNIDEENYCFDCKQFRVLYPDEAIMVCEDCGTKTTVVSNPEKPSMKDPPAENKYYEYKRYTHFCDWLANMQGKESSRVPDEVIHAVIREITREKMENRVEELSETDIKRYLKKYSGDGFDRYYDHATQILFRITDIPPVQMTAEMEQNLKLMFVEVQEPFELFKGDRRNFSSYSYIIYKFCQLLGYNEFLPKLKLHKDKIKLYEHDRIWKQICNHLGGEKKGWDFIKSYEY